MKRQLALIRFALGSAQRRAGRTLSLVAALALVTFSYSSVLFLTEALRREFRMAALALPDLTVQSLVAGRPALIRGTASRDRVDCRRGGGPTAGLGLLLRSSHVRQFYRGRGGHRRRNRAARSCAGLLEGKLPGASGEVVLGESLAAFLGLEITDAVTLPVGRAMKRLELVGTFRSQVALWTSDVILMSVADAREFLQVPPGQATDLAVRLSTPDEATVAARKIAELLPSARIVDRQLMSRTYDLTFDTRGGMMGAMLLSALVAFLILAWDRLTGVGPGERREIGVLKAVGWRTGDVLIARLWENTVIALYGAVPGILAAYGYVFLARAPGLAEVLLGWSSIYPALRLTPAVDPGQFLVLLCLVVIPFVAASLVPAWRTATHDPHSLLRGVS
jgi:ABC-type lipoprotein release transport system permease subunit